MPPDVQVFWNVKTEIVYGDVTFLSGSDICLSFMLQLIVIGESQQGNRTSPVSNNNKTCMVYIL